jgi:stage V sporulation protein B
VNAFVTVILIVLAVIIYFVLIFLFKGLTREELKEFPMGMRIARLATKLKLLK